MKAFLERFNWGAVITVNVGGTSPQAPIPGRIKTKTKESQLRPHTHLPLASDCRRRGQRPEFTNFWLLDCGRRGQLRHFCALSSSWRTILSSHEPKQTLPSLITFLSDIWHTVRQGSNSRRFPHFSARSGAPAKPLPFRYPAYLQNSPIKSLQKCCYFLTLIL